MPNKYTGQYRERLKNAGLDVDELEQNEQKGIVFLILLDSPTEYYQNLKNNNESMLDLNTEPVYFTLKGKAGAYAGLKVKDSKHKIYKVHIERIYADKYFVKSIDLDPISPLIPSSAS